MPNSRASSGLLRDVGSVVAWGLETDVEAFVELATVPMLPILGLLGKEKNMNMLMSQELCQKNCGRREKSPGTSIATERASLQLREGQFARMANRA